MNRIIRLEQVFERRRHYIAARRRALARVGHVVVLVERKVVASAKNLGVRDNPADWAT